MGGSLKRSTRSEFPPLVLPLEVEAALAWVCTSGAPCWGLTKRGLVVNCRPFEK